MIRTSVIVRDVRPALAVAVVAIILCLAVACEQPGSIASPSPTVKETTTPAVNLVDAVATFDSQKRDSDTFSPADDTRVAGEIATRKTELALTPALPPSSPPPPQPSPTWQLGVLPDCEAPNSDTFEPVSCWRGIINGQMFSVVSGTGGGGGDLTQGVIIVSSGPDFNIPLGHEEVVGVVYDTPAKVGAVRIVAVAGSQITLTTLKQDTHATFVFDITTRQFVSPPCGQSSACTPVLTQVSPTALVQPEDLGVVKCPLQPNPHTYQPINCWRGLVDGKTRYCCDSSRGLRWGN